MARRTPDQIRVTKTIDITVNGVCEACNTETLSELENSEAKSRVLPLATGRGRRVLALEDQLVLASWITKIAMMFEFMHRSGRFFTESDGAEYISTLEPFADSWVWLAQYRSAGQYTAGAMQHTFRPAPGERGGIGVTTGIVGSFAFQLLARRWAERPSSDEISVLMRPVVDRWARATVQIWPATEAGVRWPPRKYLKDDSIQPFADRWGGDSLGPR